jgi:hypothetical protein
MIFNLGDGSQRRPYARTCLFLSRHLLQRDGIPGASKALEPSGRVCGIDLNVALRVALRVDLLDNTIGSVVSVAVVELWL